MATDSPTTKAPAEVTVPPGLIAAIDATVASGTLDHATLLEVTTLRQKASELSLAISRFHNTASHDLADALTRANLAL